MFIGGGGLYAQVSKADYFTKGEALFKEKKYYEAAQCYENYLANEKKSRSNAVPFAVEKKLKGKARMNVHDETIYHLAESYRLYNDFTKAEKWYQVASKFPEAAYPDCQYWLAVTLRANQKFDEAIAAISKYMESTVSNKKMMVEADRELDNLKFIQAQLKKGTKDQFIVSPVPNTGQPSSYALAMAGSDSLVYTSIKTDSVIGKNGKTNYQYNNQLYLAVNEEDFLQKSSLINLPENGLQHGLATFTQDGKKMFFTQWIKKAGKNVSAIYMREQSDTGWTAPLKLEESINAADYNSTQPFLTKDSKYLLFASDRPGGLGNYDLYYASLDSNFQILSVDNMGNTINTNGDEQSPYYNGRTLVFSSNGRVGMGGFDIYYAEGRHDLSHWQKPVNPGAPINSVKDDIYFTSADDDNLWNAGWLSSDRASECCLAIFTVKQDSKQLINGMVNDCISQKPLAGVKLTVTDTKHKGKILTVINTDTLGKYQLEAQNLTKYTILAELPAYNSKSTAFTINARYGPDTIYNDVICIISVKDSVEKTIQVTLKTLSKTTGKLSNFSFGKSNLDGSSHTNMDSLIAVMKAHPEISVRVVGYTDAKGSDAFNLKLSTKRVDACIRYLVKNGIDKNRLEAKAMGKCCPVEPDTIDGKDNPAGREKNRRVEYELIKSDEPKKD